MGIADRQHRSDNHQDAANNVVNNALLAEFAHLSKSRGIEAGRCRHHENVVDPCPPAQPRAKQLGINGCGSVV